MKKDVAIAFGITLNYTYALANVLIGIKKHCKKFWDDIVVYHDNISEEDQLALNSILPCQFVQFDKSIFDEDAIESEALQNYSLLTLARFECFALLNKYQTVIWHDVDILIQKDFSELVQYGKESGYAATQSKTFRMEQNFFGLMPGYDMLGLLYNAGILVLHDTLPAYQELRTYCYHTYNQYAPRLRYNDQSVLNMMIQDYNIVVDRIDLDVYCCHPSTVGYENAAIIHAYGADKFWNSKRLEKQFPEWQQNNQMWEGIKRQYVKKAQPDLPEVSIVMSVFERTDFLKDAIDSILKQTFSDLELIIVVEFSVYQQQIIQTLKSFHDKRIIIIQNAQRLGFSASLNIGLTAARGTYIARMDDDDISMPNRIEKEVRFLETHPDISVVGSWIQKFGRESGVEQRPSRHKELLVWAIKENPMFHPSVLMRKADLDRYEFCYDPAWLTEDYDLWMRMMQKLTFANIPEVLHYFRASNQNITVEKADLVLNSHLDLMRRNLKEQLGLEFSRNEMLLLRQPSIIYECYNTDEMQKLRDSVVYRIYEANRERRIFDQNILEKYLGEVKYDFKTETRIQLKKYPKIYQFVRKIYRFLLRKDDRLPQEYSLPVRLKMRIFPPSSKSFHNKINSLEAQIAQQREMLTHAAYRAESIERRIGWMDEVVRRLFRENQAGFWGVYKELPPSELRNELCRREEYSDYIASLYILQWINRKMVLSKIQSLDENNLEWMHAASDLGLTAADANACPDVSDSKFDLTIASHTSGTDFAIDEVCQKSSLILYYLVPEDLTLSGWQKAIQIELNHCKDVFAAKGYVYYDLRPVVRDNWEIADKYTQSIALFIEQSQLNEVCGLLGTNCFGELESI